MKFQANIVGVVLMTGIVISIVAGVYFWGKPLVQKSADKQKIQSFIDLLDDISNTISYVSSTQNPQKVVFSLGDGDYIRILNDTDAIEVETNVIIPIVVSSDWLPVDYFQSPYERENIYVNTSYECSDCDPDPAGKTITPPIFYGNKTLYDGNYSIVVYNLTESNGTYNYVCIVPVLSSQYGSSDCGYEGDEIYRGNYSYKVGYIKDDGKEVILLGDMKENIGELGKDPAGIIVGKAYPTGNGYKTFLRLWYRGLIDSENVIHRIHLVCDNKCEVTNGRYSLFVYPNDIVETEQGVDIYLKVYFERS